MIVRTVVFAAAAVAWAAAAAAYPGGTPSFQTDVAPFCAGCHSSLAPAALAGAGERATKELAENKHLAVIRAADPRTGYAELSEAQRAELVKHIQALDRGTTVTLEAPARVPAGGAVTVIVKVTGGAGPVVGVGLVDRDHRWYARPAASAGWQVVSPPRITVAGQQKKDWLEKRPAEAGRNLSFVNVTGIRSDASAGKFASAEVAFTLRAPVRKGPVPLAAVLLYGTEKSSPHGTVSDATGRKRNRGGLTAGSGRVLFTPVQTIQVE